MSPLRILARSLEARRLSVGRLVRRSLLGALMALGVAAPRAALAFCRTSTGGLEDQCTIGVDNCCTIGKPLYWKNGCVGYSIHRPAGRYVSFEDTSRKVAESFTKWTEATCPTDGSGTSRVSIDVRDLGPVDCGVVAYDKQGGPNQHVIAYRDDVWGHADGDNTLALTTVVFNPDTGEIYDADMEINTADVKVTVDDPIPVDGYDFGSIVTHEVGHFLGMAHATDQNATMFAHYQNGATAMRNLTLDDVNGICAAYPPTRVRVTGDDPELVQGVCDPTPRGGFTTQCPPPPSKKSCAVSTPGAGGSSSYSYAAPLMLGVLLLRRRSALSFRRGCARATKPARLP